MVTAGLTYGRFWIIGFWRAKSRGKDRSHVQQADILPLILLAQRLAKICDSSLRKSINLIWPEMKVPRPRIYQTALYPHLSLQAQTGPGEILPSWLNAWTSDKWKPSGTMLKYWSCSCAPLKNDDDYICDDRFDNLLTDFQRVDHVLLMTVILTKN